MLCTVRRLCQLRIGPLSLHRMRALRSPLISALQTVDVGCGIGGSSRHIAAKYGSSGKGVTLSPVQVGKLHRLKDFACQIFK